ncbi:hypothetical protein [Pseudoduganella aquatica]|uniref:Uncharacterized protein n=1 Tax=Pseudoduganella aquatica TaxID=2660641 RepID=A0A7X4HFM2_9BURK|nr:hypothetical protein [Pseudoduganella aquatica]MYN09893.1 hypothetical protein [Pseudoduganella aquatica]
MNLGRILFSVSMVLSLGYGFAVAIQGRIDFYKNLIAGKASISVSLQSKNMEDWSVVNNISAEIGLMYI